MDDEPVEPRILVPYLRQSKARPGETDKTSLSFDAQESVIRDWGARHGYNQVEAAIRDHDLVGDEPNRPGLREIEERARPGVTIACYKWDRLARDLILQETIVRGMARRGVPVVSVTESNERVARIFHGWMAEEYKLALSERVRDAKRSLARRGRFLGSNAPFGYRRTGTREVPTEDGGTAERPSGPLIRCPVEGPVHDELFARLDAGEPMFAIAVDLDRRGVPTKRGGPWTVTTIRRIVTNPVSMGDVVHRGRVVATDAHDPLVSRELWHRVNDRLAREATLRRRTPNDLSSWCEGLVVHGEGCGRRLYLIPIQGKRRRDGTRSGPHGTFACRTVYEPVRCAVRPRMLSARKLEAAVRACLVADLAGVRPLANAIAEAQAVAGGDAAARAARALNQRRAAAERRHNRARERWLNGREPDAWMDAEDARFETELAAVQAELADLPAAPDRARYAAVAELLASFGALLAEAGDDTLRAVLDRVGVAVLDPAGVAIRYHPEFRSFVPCPAIVCPSSLLVVCP